MPKPPQGTRRRVNKAGSTSSQSSSFTASFEGELTTATSTTVATINTTSTNDTSITTVVASTTSAQQNDENLFVKHRTTSSDDTQGNQETTSLVSTSLSFPLDKSADNNATKKPVPVPRRNTLDRNLMASSPLALSSMRSPNTSTTSLPSIDVKDDDATAAVQLPRKASFPRQSSSSSLSTTGSLNSTLQSKESTTSSNNVVIPIALAIQEIVNASFKGKTYENLYSFNTILCYY